MVSGMRMKRTDVKTSFFLPPALLHAAKVHAATEGLSLRAWLVAAVVAYLPESRRPAQFRPSGDEGRAA
jgi:hypothetical protein